MAEPTALTPAATAELLNAAAVTLRAEIEAIPRAALRWHPAPGEWCVHEVVGHLIETERRGFAGRIRVILGGENPKLATWDQVQVARDRRDCERDIASLLNEFHELREASVALVRGLTAAQVERGGDHETVGWLRVHDLLHEWAHHDRNHLKQIMANVQSFVWPHMGNARRFSEG
jgi:hypothetical protein